jgi:RNA polymerase sigma-19 factor, ECF subfamily
MTEEVSVLDGAGTTEHSPGADAASPQGSVLERAYRAHRSAVMAFLRRSLKSEEDAEDLTHDTFLRANGSGQLGQLRQPVAFLLHIARNLVRDHFRRQKLASFSALEDIVDLDPPDPSGTPEQIAHARRELQLLAQVLMALPERTRQAVTLHKFHHLTYRQVAVVMGTSPKTVEKQLARGIAECRRVVRGEGVSSGGQVLPYTSTTRSSGDVMTGRARP